MTTSLEARKLRIIDNLVELTDENILLLIEALLRPETDFWNDLSETQKSRIEAAIRQLDGGQGVPHETVTQEMRKRYQR